MQHTFQLHAVALIASWWQKCAKKSGNVPIKATLKQYPVCVGSLWSFEPSSITLQNMLQKLLPFWRIQHPPGCSQCFSREHKIWTKSYDLLTRKVHRAPAASPHSRDGSYWKVSGSTSPPAAYISHIDKHPRARNWTLRQHSYATLTQRNSVSSKMVVTTF